MKQFILLIINLFVIVTLSAQPTFNNAYRVASDSTFYTEFGSIVATDSAYYISGVTQDTLDGYTLNRGMLMKIDTNGNKVWSSIYGDTTYTTETWYDAMIITNQGYLANVGRNSYDGSSFLLITDYNGNIITNKNYSDTYPIILSGVTQDNSNNFYLIGALFYTYDSETILIKTDSLGNEIWRQYYDAFPIVDSTNSTYANDIFFNSNGDLIIGSIKTKDYDFQLSFELGTWVLQIDTAGNILNEYRTPINRWIAGSIITLTQDGGLLSYGYEGVKQSINSTHYDYEGYISKLDNNLQLVWEKRYGIEWSRFLHIKEKDNGHFICTGGYFSDRSLDDVSLTGWMMELDENGDSLWQREFIIFPGVYQWHALGDFEFLDDGGMIVSGYIQNMTPGAGNFGNYWGWLIRTDSLGCIVPGCQLLDNTENVAVVFDNEVVVYPNPASEVVRFRFEKPIDGKTEIRVYSGLGQEVGRVLADNVEQAQVNVSDWNSGVYFYGVYVEGKLVKQGQVLVQH